jgi:large subunit ribosomal protein L3
MLGLLARKIGMTQIFDGMGNLVPVTVLRIDPNIVVAKKSRSGHFSVVLGVDDMKKNKIIKPYAGQFLENITPKKHIKELHNFEKEVVCGDSLGVEVFDDVRYVDVTGVSKGKGFQGVVKRWGFGGGRYTHGSKFHREPGSTGQSTYPGKTFKNVKLPGRMGHDQVTVLSLKVAKIDREKRCIMVQGAVPGVSGGLILIRVAVKKYSMK